MGDSVITRRGLLQAGALSVIAGAATGCVSLPKQSARVVVVGGGFAGATCARLLKRLEPSLTVTLLEPKTHYVSCPFSNLVLGGIRTIEQQTFGYESLAREGIVHVKQPASDIDVMSRTVTIADSSAHKLSYDKLVLAPGIAIDYSALQGYEQGAEQWMPHAWQAGSQTLLLAKQLQVMPDGGQVVISVPANPYRCPPGPYERASLIAAYLKQHKPKAKILLLDGKDRFSKQSLFMSEWRRHYGDMINWQGLSDGATVREVKPRKGLLITDFDDYRADVANVIPPQKAGKIAAVAGVTDASGWCPVQAGTFESTLAADVHVIGDAAIANAMPKSAFAANAQAKLCAVQILQSLRGHPSVDTTLINTCYSMVTPDEAISVAGVYSANERRWREVPGAGGVSPAGAPREFRRKEAVYAEHWFNTITAEVFG